LTQFDIEAVCDSVAPGLTSQLRHEIVRAEFPPI
jgi:hypothetical protein